MYPRNATQNARHAATGSPASPDVRLLKTVIFSRERATSMIPMTETRPVRLVVDLPESMADDLEDMSDKDPEYLGRAIQYALARRIIFEELTTPVSEGI
jgi:hypothetical protein